MRTSILSMSFILPALLFAQIELTPFPDLCYNGDAYPLAHASPSGGNWSGDNVVDNVFHPSQPAIYHLTYSVMIDGEISSASQWLYVRDTPELEIIYGEPGQCIYEPLGFSANIPGGSWGGIFNGLSTIYRGCENRPLQGIGSYELNVANGGSCYALTETFDLPGCIVNGLEGDTVICTVDGPLIYHLDVNTSIGGSLTLGGDFNEIVQLANGAIGTFYPSMNEPGDHHLTASIHYPGKCARFDTIKVTLLEPVDELILVPFDTLCASGVEYVLDHATPTGGIWSGEYVANNMLYPGEPGTHTLTYNYGVPGTSCHLAVTQAVIVSPPPVITHVSGSNTCSEEDWLFTAEPAGGWWDGAAGPGGIVDMSCANRPLHGIVTYTLPMGNGDCHALWDYFYAPACLNVDLGPDLTLCEDSETLEFFIGGPATAGSAYLEGVDSIIYHQVIPAVTGYFHPDQHPPGTYTIIGHVSGGNHCPDSDTLEITIHVPEVFLSLTDSVNLSWPAFQLAEGSPAPGFYQIQGSDEVIILFDPATAGLGTHYIVYTHTDPLTGCKGTALDSIYVGLSVGLIEHETATLYVFPNPARGEVTVTFDDTAPTRLLIHDASGRVILARGVRTSPVRLDVSSLSAGTYLIILEGQEQLRSVLVIE